MSTVEEVVNLAIDEFATTLAAFTSETREDVDRERAKI